MNTQATAPLLPPEIAMLSPRAGFPAISYDIFQTIRDPELRRAIATKNRVIRTDAYNRTMIHLDVPELRDALAVYTMTFRKAANGTYNVIYGVRNKLEEILSAPITQAELDFAEKFYEEQAAKGGNGYFDKKMWQEVVDNGGMMPLTIRAVEDGQLMRVGEPILSVEGPNELAAHFEPDFLRIFYQTAVATDMHRIEHILGPGRVVEFGKRAGINEEAHMDAVEACYVGGGLRVTSSDTAACAIPEVIADPIDRGD